MYGICNVHSLPTGANLPPKLDGLKFVFSKKATKNVEIFTVDLTLTKVITNYEGPKAQ